MTRNESLRLERTRKFSVFSRAPEFPRAKDGAIVIDAAFLASQKKAVTGLGSGDSMLLADIVDEDSLFESVRDECMWSEMSHKGSAVPRLVCMQGTFLRGEDGDSIVIGEPVYRHPADAQPQMCNWTPAVENLRLATSRALGGQLINHALIQWYRDGKDYISEHADKTLDIARGSAIVNLSLGCTRTMVLRGKKGFSNKEVGAEHEEAAGKTKIPPENGGSGGGGTKPTRATQRVNLPHGSLFVLGWGSNLEMTHEIRQDKRLARDKSAAELAFGGQRISLTFRSVATFQRHSDGKLFGQGAPAKNEAALDDDGDYGGGCDGSDGGGCSGNKNAGGCVGGGGVGCVAGDQNKVTAETDALVAAFGAENRDPKFDWDATYAQGFSVMNMANASNLVATDAKAANAEAAGRGGGDGGDLPTSSPSCSLPSGVEAGGGMLGELRSGEGEEEEAIQRAASELAVRTALQGGLPQLAPLGSNVSNSRCCVLSPLSFFCAWNGVLCLVFDGFPPALAQLKQRLNTNAAAAAAAATVAGVAEVALGEKVEGGLPNNNDSSSGTSARFLPASAAAFKSENFGSKWPKCTLAALHDQAPCFTLAQLQRLRRLCLVHGERLAEPPPPPLVLGKGGLVVSELTVVHYTQRGLESKGLPTKLRVPLAATHSSGVCSTATAAAAAAAREKVEASERTRVRSVLSEWQGERLSGYLDKVNTPGSRISSYRHASPKGSTLVAELGLGAECHRHTHQQHAARGGGDGSVSSSSSSSSSSNSSNNSTKDMKINSNTRTTPPSDELVGAEATSAARVWVSKSVAAFRASVDKEFPGYFAWLDPASLHCTVRSLDC